MRVSKTQVGRESDLTIYIEGDGAHWLLQMAPPPNPTPRKSLVVSLATQDQSPFILYLARPCQYIDIAQFKDCDPSLWTDGRFSPTAIQLANDVIDKVLLDLPKVRLNLVGHSGGGTLATLLAAKRSDIRCLVTLAAPLDIAAWTQSVSVGSLRLSKNPADPNIQLKNTRQTHFFGEKDAIVKKESIGNYRNFSDNADFIVISGFDHTKAWAKQWPMLQKKSCLALD
jgi:pimeloyl-ACP methyl ester carboxylesterase